MKLGERLRLNNDALMHLDAERVDIPQYDRAAIEVGVLHIGPGAFHRAHQADYFDRLLNADPRWGIVDVSLRSHAIKNALDPQDTLYTLVMLDDDVRYRIIGSVKSVIQANNTELQKLFQTPAIRLVTLTVTEKGYCLKNDGTLDFDHPDITADLQNPVAPRSAIACIVQLLRARFEHKIAVPDILSCDNLSSNGDKLRSAVLAFAETIDRDLAARIADEVRFPNSMVDSITPATDQALRDRVLRDTGIEDRWPIQREKFSSWVIEDNVSKEFPGLSSVGAVMTSNVASHERAKLRMLNGAHSTLAYFGLSKGYLTVAEAMADIALAAFLDEMMRSEIAPSLSSLAGLDYDAYRHALLSRFRNPSIAHSLSQIAWDGSQKLPIRLLATIEDNLACGRPIERLSTGVASWMRFVRRAARYGDEIVDPKAAALAEIGGACRDDPAFDCTMFLERSAVFSEALKANPKFRQQVKAAYEFVQAEEVNHQ